MTAALLPSEREFFNLYGMTESRLQLAKDNAIVMHPGPINRGVEIANEVPTDNRPLFLIKSPMGSLSVWRLWR